MHLVFCPVGLPPLPLGLGLARGGGVSLDSRLLRASAPLSLQLLRELERGRLLVRSGLPLPASLPRLLLPVLHRTLDNVKNWEKFRRTAPAFDPPVVPDLSDRGARKDRRARSRSDSSRDRGRRSRSCSSYRSRPRGRERRGRSSSRSLSSRERMRRDLRIAPALDACALVLGETGLDPQIDTGLAETALAVTGHGLLTTTDHVDSVCVPLLAEELAVPRRSRDRLRSRG